MSHLGTGASGAGVHATHVSASSQYPFAGAEMAVSQLRQRVPTRHGAGGGGGAASGAGIASKAERETFL